MKTEDMRIGFIGMSHLGLNSAVVAANNRYKVTAYDKDEDKIRDLKLGVTPIEEPGLRGLLEENSERLHFTAEKNTLSSCEIIYISSDVSTNDQGESDLTTVKNNLEICLKYKSPRSIVVVLSQVPPGFTRSYSSPEIKLFYQVETLIFGRAIERASKPERYIIGSSNADMPIPKNYLNFLESHGNPPIIQMSYESAELAKISINCMLVASISAANSLAELCENINADWDEIIPALRLDKRIGQYSYIAAGLGIAGGNLERDLATVIRLGEENDCDTQVIESWLNNSSYRKNWCYRLLQTHIFSEMDTPQISVLGLAYKENTDSIKNSASVLFLQQIKGHQIKIFDPVVPLSRVPYAEPCDNVLSCIKGSDVLLIMTPWPDFKTLDRKVLSGSMNGRFIIDPFGCLKHLDLNKCGFRYFSLGKS